MVRDVKEAARKVQPKLTIGKPEERPMEVMKKVVEKRDKALTKLNRGKKHHVKPEGKKK